MDITKQCTTVTALPSTSTSSSSGLLLLPRKAIVHIAKQYFTSEVSERAAFLKQFSFFESLQERDLLNIIIDFKQTSRRKDAVLFKEGEPVSEVFFIKHGAVELFSSVSEVVEEGRCK